MGDVTEKHPRFGEYLAGYFYDAFRVVGVTQVSTNVMEKLRVVGERMAVTIEHAAERKAILVAKKLQDAVINGFNAVDAKFQQHKEAKQALLDLITGQTEQLQGLDSGINALAKGLNVQNVETQALREAIGVLQQKVAEIEDIMDITEDQFDVAVIKAVKEAEEENETLTDRVSKLESLRVDDVTVLRKRIETLEGRADRMAEIEGVTEDLFTETSVKEDRTVVGHRLGQKFVSRFVSPTPDDPDRSSAPLPKYFNKGTTR